MLTCAGRANCKLLEAAVMGGDEAALEAALAATEGQTARETEAREVRMRAKGMRDRARLGWDRVRIAVSELSWRRLRRVFRKKRRAVVEGPVPTVELVGAVLWMAWERAREGWRRETEETAEQTEAELAVRQQERMQRGQQQNAAADTVTAATKYSNKVQQCNARGCESGYSSDSAIEAAEVATVAMREWDRQHGWLHPPEQRAADRREAGAGREQ